jgi:hypothetical protein
VRDAIRKMHWVLYTVFFASAAWVSVMGYHQVMLTRTEKLNDIATWLPKKEIVRLIRYHGTDGLKITQDEVYIYRGEKWIPVRKRNQG